MIFVLNVSLTVPILLVHDFEYLVQRRVVWCGLNLIMFQLQSIQCMYRSERRCDPTMGLAN